MNTTTSQNSAAGSLRLILTLLAALTSTTAGLASDAGWRIETVDPGGGGAYATVRLDSYGNAHAAYIKQDQHQLRYGFWDRKVGKWFLMTLDESTSGFASMALDSLGRPHVSYVQYGIGYIRYARWNGTSWIKQTLPIPSKLFQFYTSIALDPDDRPTITGYQYRAAGFGDSVLHLCAMSFVGDAWEVSTVDSTIGSGKFNFASRGATGRVDVAYANVRAENAGLRYATFDGAAWKVEILEGADRPFPVYSVAMAVGPDGAPHIAYTDVVNRRVKYAVKRGARWILETVDVLAEEAYPDRNGLALDSEGNPYLSYHDAGVGVLKVAYRRAGAWMREVVDDQPVVGFTSSIDVRNGMVMIGYLDSSTNSFKCARRSAPVVARTSGP